MAEKNQIPEKLRNENLPLQEMWEKRGTDQSFAHAIPLGPEWRSENGLPLAVACREHEYKFEGWEQLKKLVYVAIFEERSWHKKPNDMVPVGFIVAQEYRINPKDQNSPTEMVGFNGDQINLGVTVKNPKSKRGYDVDPLFSSVIREAYEGFERVHKLGNDAFSVGFNQTRADVRNTVLDRLKEESKITQGDYDDMYMTPDNIRPGWDRYMNTHRNVGDLLLKSLGFATKQFGHDKLYLVSPSAQTRKLIQRSKVAYKEMKGKDVPAFPFNPTSPAISIDLTK